MISISDLQLTLTDSLSVLVVTGCRFHLTGGLASSYYGEPRFTQDIDIVISLEPGKILDLLISKLDEKFIVDRTVIEDGVRRQSMFQALHKETIIKVDFHIGESIPGELQRSTTEEILTGIFAPIVAKEDAILSKLLWIKKGSHKSRQDIKMMIHTGKIDLESISKTAEELGVSQILEELLLELNLE